MDEPPDDVRALAEPHVPNGTWTSVGWDHGESRVWRVEGRTTVYVKRHRRARKQPQELRAYRDWLSQHPGRCPTVLAADRTTLVLSALPGRLVDGLELPQTVAIDLHRQAGRWLRALHDVPIADGRAPWLATDIPSRAREWATRAEGLVANRVTERLLDTVTVECFADCDAVPCHRDFSPRNWLVDDHGQLGVIDFESSHPDCAMVDLVKLVQGPWLDDPSLEPAFWKGYGRTPGPEDRARLDALDLLVAVSTVVWARDHHDATFEAFGRTQIDRWLASHADGPSRTGSASP
ncbi:MAG: aminoglycoside phosphotransferase family protein [Myxococcota bacterium]